MPGSSGGQRGWQVIRAGIAGAVLTVLVLGVAPGVLQNELGIDPGRVPGIKQVRDFERRDIHLAGPALALCVRQPGPGQTSVHDRTVPRSAC
jgi:hypothetical protein